MATLSFLIFPIVGSTLTFTSSNTKPSQPCVFSVAFKVGNITGSTLSVTYGGVTHGTATFDRNLSATQNTLASLIFTSPAASVASLNFNIIGNAGTLYTWNWSAYSGSSINTQIRGNLTVPYGTVLVMIFYTEVLKHL